MSAASINKEFDMPRSLRWFPLLGVMAIAAWFLPLTLARAVMSLLIIAVPITLLLWWLEVTKPRE